MSSDRNLRLWLGMGAALLGALFVVAALAGNLHWAWSIGGALVFFAGIVAIK